MNQQQLTVNFNTNAIKKFSIGGNYRLGFANSTTDGAGSFPAYSYDLSNEYGSSSLDLRHNLNIYGTFQLPWKIQASPSISFSSGRPFNITSGVDSNRDSIFNDRPTYSQLFDICTARGLTNGFCSAGDVSNPETTIIPRNFGRGPGASVVNLGLNRTFSFKAGKDKNYNFNLSMQISNLFNWTNQGTPIGNLTSDRFGQPFSSTGGFSFGNTGGAANRRIELQGRFNF
jgi:hypothetical protein